MTNVKSMKHKEVKKIGLQLIITLFAIFFAVTHILFPDVSIDFITITLFFFAIIPWLSPLFKSVGFPGGASVEYNLDSVERELDKVHLLKDVSLENTSYVPNISDPQLVLAWLRIEIEKKIRTLSREHSLRDDRSMIKILTELCENGILSHEEVRVLDDLKNTLNKAIHGIHVETNIARQAINIGPKVLAALDLKMKK